MSRGETLDLLRQLLGFYLAQKDVIYVVTRKTFAVSVVQC